MLARFLFLFIIVLTSNAKATNFNNRDDASLPIYDQIFNKDMGHRVFLSSLRGPLGIVLEHPLDLLKTLQQTQPEKSARELARQVYKQHGPLGFYKGVVPTFTMSVIKPSYRLPLIGILPDYFKGLGYDGVAPYLQTGLTIASIESCVISPLERIKVWIMTNNNNNGGDVIREIAKVDPDIRRKIRKNALDVVYGRTDKFISPKSLRQPLNASYLFKGFNFQFATTSCAWTTFMASNYYTKSLILGGEERPLNLYELIFSGVVSGVAVTATALPADFLKTAVQKHGSEFAKSPSGVLIEDNNKNANNKVPSLMESTKRLIQKEGFSALYAGWRLKLVGYILRATTINVANYVIDNIMGKG